MELPFSEDTFVEIVSSEIFDDCVSQDGEFSHAVFAELIKNGGNELCCVNHAERDRLLLM